MNTMTRARSFEAVLNGNFPHISIAASGPISNITELQQTTAENKFLEFCRATVFYRDCQRLGLRLPWKQAITTILCS
jgi:hypothetical protein